MRKIFQYIQPVRVFTMFEMFEMCPRYFSRFALLIREFVESFNGRYCRENFSRLPAGTSFIILAKRFNEARWNVWNTFSAKPVCRHTFQPACASQSRITPTALKLNIVAPVASYVLHGSNIISSSLNHPFGLESIIKTSTR